jgi:endothelin-converting enzyme/putative endopeptidase
VSTESYLDNLISARGWTLSDSLAQTGKPVDRSEWIPLLAPQTANASYQPSLNSIFIPAAVLRPPFFSRTAPFGQNYGAIGRTIGHEMSHGFDDNGRKYDAVGNVRSWWTPEVSAAFDSRTQCLVDQYSSYTVSGGVHLDGKLELGENIGDLGGMRVAFRAFQLAKAAGGGQVIVGPHGFTDEQEVFVAYAQSRCSLVNDEQARVWATTDPHAPDQYRVNGVMLNLPEFARAFGCPLGSPMAPASRCEIW